MKNLARSEIRRLERLIEGLGSPHDIDAAVHETRKGIKRLRAYLRLARKSIGTTTYRVENAALRDTARLLAPVRDAFVFIGTAEDLGADPSILTVLEERHHDALASLESGGRLEARRRLEAIEARWRISVASNPDAASISAGLKRTYRRALVDYERVLTKPVDEAFHGWRRRTKYLRYQLEALDAPKKLVRGFLRLGDDLGLEHDQTVLVAMCEQCSSHAGFDNLKHRATERRAELRARAIKHGAALYDEEPDAFQRRILKDLGLSWKTRG